MIILAISFGIGVPPIELEQVNTLPLWSDPASAKVAVDIKPLEFADDNVSTKPQLVMLKVTEVKMVNAPSSQVSSPETLNFQRRYELVEAQFTWTLSPGQTCKYPLFG